MTPPRREQRKTYLDASVVPVSLALLARADALEAEALTVSANIGNDAGWDRIKEVEAHKVISAIATEFRALAEELHWQ